MEAINNPEISQKVKELIIDYNNQYSSCKDLEQYYILFCSNLILTEMIKKHFNDVALSNDDENCLEIIEVICKGFAKNLIKNTEKKLFTN
jgi:hypothetical protein